MTIPSQDHDIAVKARNAAAKASAKYREANREKLKLRMRAWRENNREKSRLHSREWRNRKLAQGTAEEVALIRAAESAKTKRNQARYREQTYAAYGGYVCACCGETEPMFLSIDHVHNDGASQRKAKLHNGGGSFYKWLRKHGFPSGYQVLCMNCNVGKYRNKGVCPHRGKV